MSDKYNEEDQRKTWEGFDHRDPSQTAADYRVALSTKRRERGWVDTVLKNSEADFNTDLGNARRLIVRHGANIRFVPEWGRWFDLGKYALAGRPRRRNHAVSQGNREGDLRRSRHP